MKFKQQTRKNTWACLLPTALIFSLVACDDVTTLPGSNTSTVPQSDPIILPSGAATGVLLGNTPISGVSFTASSGTSGVTDEAGNFNFSYGDTIEFKIGKLSLGNVAAVDIITPVTLAEKNENKLTNLITLLQSLDADSDTSNGISISDDVASALSGSIDLQGNPNSFADSANLQAILDENGIGGEVKTPKQANELFLAQGINIFDAYTWATHNGSVASMLRIAKDGSGEYLHGSARPDDSCDENRVCRGRVIYKAGAEYGTAKTTEVDGRGFIMRGEPVVDTNLRDGLSYPAAKRRVRTDGLALIYSDIVPLPLEREQKGLFSEIFHIGGASSTVSAKKDAVAETVIVDSRLRKVANDPSGIIGAWAYDQDTINTRTMVFFPDGKFFLVDPTGETQREDQADCAKPGVEYANYTYNSSANQLNISGFTYNTDGCVGLSSLESNEAHKFTISADGHSARLEKHGDEPVTVYRISE